MKWVECPLMLIKGTKVEISQCARCTEKNCKSLQASAADVIKEYFTAAVDPVRADNLMETKKRRKQMCPVTTAERLGYCTAHKRYCRYNTVCADDNPAAVKTIVYMEKKMLIITGKDGKTTQVPKTIKAFTAETKDFRNIASVTESLMGVRVVMELLPHNEKAKQKAMPSELKNVTKVLSATGEVSIEELLKMPSGTEAWIPAAVYMPQTKLEVFKAPGVTAKKKSAPKKTAEGTK